jgi:hypothetical protein
MALLLDPSGRYFGSRVIAQGVPDTSGEDGAPAPVVHKRLLHGLEGCEPVVLIVDDSSAVWPNDRRNLFVVERYIYFPSSRKRLGLAGKSLMEVDRWVRWWCVFGGGCWCGGVFWGAERVSLVSQVSGPPGQGGC